MNFAGKSLITKVLAFFVIQHQTGQKRVTILPNLRI